MTHAQAVPELLGTRRLTRSRSLLLTRRGGWARRSAAAAGHGVLLLLTSSSVLAVLFIFYFIARDALPFFQGRGLREFFTSTLWYPTQDPPQFGALAIFFGSLLVTLGAALFAVPLGVLGAVCLSDMLPFAARQCVKPVIEVLAAIPSVAYGFFAFVVLAPLLQNHGGAILATTWWVATIPVVLLAAYALSDVLTPQRSGPAARRALRLGLGAVLGAVLGAADLVIGLRLAGLTISSGTNALNVSLILGIMALPTIMSVSEDALQAVGRELREGAYALGATRAEMLVRVILPAAASGVGAAVILGLMRAIGETMVVWMASGNAAQIPHPWFNLLEPIRTLTATIAGEMGEADQMTGSLRYHVLFAMALSLLTISFVCNLLSERLVRRPRRRASG